MLGYTREEIAQLSLAHWDAQIPAAPSVSLGVAECDLLCYHATLCWRGQRDACPREPCRVGPADLIALADKALYEAK